MASPIRMSYLFEDVDYGLKVLSVVRRGDTVEIAEDEEREEVMSLLGGVESVMVRHAV